MRLDLHERHSVSILAGIFYSIPLQMILEAEEEAEEP
jgi:hypothetical protein